MYYNRYKLYSPDSFEGGGGPGKGGDGEGGDSEGGDSEGGKDYSSDGDESGNDSTQGDISEDLFNALVELEKVSDYSLTEEEKETLSLAKYKKGKRKQLEAERERDNQDLITKPDIVEDIVTLNPIVNKLYNTISCPCGYLPIIESGKVVNCERDEFGIKTYVNPIIISNHQIASRTPEKNDKWACDNKLMKCEQGGFKWDTLYVVQVEQNKTRISSSFLNSKISQSNCYIPQFTLTDYGKPHVDSFRFPKYEGDAIGVDINNPDKIINKIPLFKEKDQAERYNEYWDGGTGVVSSYVDGDEVKYFPGEYYPKQKLITSCSIGIINGFGQLDERLTNATKTYASTKKKNLVAAAGGLLNIVIGVKNKPTFSIEIKDSSGCSILDKKIENFTPRTSPYKLTQKFPALLSGQASETYSFKLTPSADTSYHHSGHGLIKAGIIIDKVWQFKNPTFTLQASDLTDITTNTFTTSAVTIKGNTNEGSGDLSLTHTTTLGVNSGNLYIKNDEEINLNNLTTVNGNVITKFENPNSGFPECMSDFKVEHSIGDLEVGMKFSGEVEVTKVVRKSINNDEDYCGDDIVTNQFELDDTTNLFPGMTVAGLDFFTELISIDSGRQVTLNTERVITNDTSLIFSHKSHGIIHAIEGDIIKAGLKQFSACVKLPNKTVLTFEKSNKSMLFGDVSFDKSGSETIVITSTVSDARFGQDDKTFTLDTDKFITNKPNAHDYYISIGKNSSYTINFIRNDVDYNRYSKTVTASNPSNGALVANASSCYKTYTPSANFTGKDRIRFTVSDGTTTSDEKSIFITVK